MKMKYKSHESFFDSVGCNVVRSHFYEMQETFTVEEMYQHFKARYEVERAKEGGAE